MKEFTVGSTSISLALFADATNSMLVFGELALNGCTFDYPLKRVDVVTKRELLEAMQGGKLEIEIAFLNASLIPDVLPVLVAAHKAVLYQSRGSLKTRTLHSELVYNYSGSKHISESLKRCGISDSTTYILAARIGASADEMKSVVGLIKGKEIDLKELESRANTCQIQKHYKIPGPELEISSLADAITCRIAARDAL